MTFADSVAAVMKADTGAGGVATLLTGGIYTYTETGGFGISPTSTPSAFNAKGILLPCAVVKDRDQVPDNGPKDDCTQVKSYRQVVEIWLYDDRAAGFAAITTVRSRVFVLLDGKRVSSCLFRWINNVLSKRDPVLKNAVFERADYETRALQP